MTHQEQLNNIYALWVEVKPIKRRCHDATDDDLAKVARLVSAYHGFIGKTRLKVSACLIPKIIHTVAKLLKGHGIIDNIYA